jgi:putative membrane protein insertion efficiency factor
MTDDTNAPGPRHVLGRIVALPVHAYRVLISPLKPACCRFVPTCSAYATEALARHGAVRGGILTIQRLLRCHPFCEGGFDPVPGSDLERRAAAFGARDDLRAGSATDDRPDGS